MRCHNRTWVNHRKAKISTHCLIGSKKIMSIIWYSIKIYHCLEYLISHFHSIRGPKISFVILLVFFMYLSFSLRVTLSVLRNDWTQELCSRIILVQGYKIKLVIRVRYMSGKHLNSYTISQPCLYILRTTSDRLLYFLKFNVLYLIYD